MKPRFGVYIKTPKTQMSKPMSRLSQATKIVGKLGSDDGKKTAPPAATMLAYKIKPLISPTATVILRASNADTNKIPATMAAIRIATRTAGWLLSQGKQRELPRDRL